MRILCCFLFGLLTTSLVAAHAVSLNLSSYLGGNDNDRVNDVAVSAGGDLYAVGATESTDFPGADVAAEPDGAVFVSRIDGDGVVFTALLDGEDTDTGISIAVDDLGAAYVTGPTASRDFPLRNAFQSTLNPGLSFPSFPSEDAFVTKLDASGAIMFSTFLGGRNGDSGSAIALDANRRPYVAGFTLSNNFPLKNEFQDAEGLFTTVNAFLTVFAADGRSLAYSTQLGGGDSDGAESLAVDRAGNAYLAGGTDSRDFPVKGPFQPSLQGGKDAWVAKLNPASSGAASLVYSTYLGGAGDDKAFGIAVDAAGQAHVTGVTGSSSFPLAAPPGRRPLDSTIAGDDVFVTELNAQGNGLLFSTFLGGSGTDRGLAIAVDGAGAEYVAGSTNSANFPAVNAFQSALSGEDDGFVAKIDPLRSSFLWSSYLGGRDFDKASGIALDPRANVYLGGETFSGATFPRIAAFQNDFGGGPSDGFLARIETTAPDTIGVFRETEGKFFLRNSNTAGAADFTVTLGQHGDLPVAGNWLGFGDRPGVFRQGTFILRPFNNDILCCNITFAFGQAGDQPVAGDWDGDGIDTVGVFTSIAEFQLINSNAFGEVELAFLFGNVGDVPLAGDWNGDGIDTIGVFRPSTGEFFLRNTNDTGIGDITVAGFAQAGDLPVVGDWNGDGIDTIGVFRGSTGQFLVRNKNTPGPADLVVDFGLPGDRPIAGDWDGRP